MIKDVTDLANAIRRQDVSAALRSFTVAGLFIALAMNLGQSVFNGGESETIVEFSSTGDLGAPPPAALSLPPGFALLQLAISIPFLFLSVIIMVVLDGAARQPWRSVSGAIALGSGILLTVLRVMAFSVVVLFATLPFIPRDMLADALPELDEMLYAFGQGDFGALIAATPTLIVLAIAFWLLQRQVAVETSMAAGAPRELLLGDISGSGLGARMAYVFSLPSSMWRMGALRTPAFWLFILARGLIYASLIPLGILGALMAAGQLMQSESMAYAIAVLVLLVAAHLVFWLAKRLAARRIWAPEEEGGPAPILFLRSFGDDRVSFRRPWWDPVGRWFDLWSFRGNADEMLIDEFALYGPVIALGKPGEASAPFGASRRYSTHEDWQKVIADAAARASAIVAVAGDTPGLMWEYSLIRDNHYGDKTIFLFPPGRQDSDRVVKARNLFTEAFGNILSPPDSSCLIAHSGSGDALAAAPTATAYLAALRGFLQQRERAAGRPVGDGRLTAEPVLMLIAGVALGVILMLLVLMLTSIDDF